MLSRRMFIATALLSSAGVAEAQVRRDMAPSEPQPASAVDAESVLDALLEVLGPSEAAKIAARITGLPRRELYRKALELAK